MQRLCQPSVQSSTLLNFGACACAERFQLLQTKQPDYYIVVLEGMAFCHLDAKVLSMMTGHDIVLVNLNSRHVTIADLDKQKIVASATLLIEYKILRNCGKVYFLLLQCLTCINTLTVLMPDIFLSAGWARRRCCC